MRHHTGAISIEIDIPRQTRVAEFKNKITEMYPAWASLVRHMLISINHEYAFDEAIIPDHAEIA